MNNIFQDTQIAFATKSDSQLERANFLFSMIKSEKLVKIGTAATNFAIKAHLPVEGLIRATVFDHFCGGVTERDCVPNIEKNYKKGVASILDYSVEGKENEEEFNKAMNKTLDTIEFAKNNPAIPFAVFKPTGFGRFALYQKLTEGLKLSEQENDEWEIIKSRFNKVCKAAFEADVPLLIDAEESWMQDAADDLIEEMMATYNVEKAIVYNTLQMYRWDRLDYLKALHERADEIGFHIGMKIVRGAYMEKERERAQEMGYESPICVDKAATDQNYNACLTYMVENGMNVYAGTHNEESSLLFIELMNKFGIEKTADHAWFGQLFGMSDHISFNLGALGYNVSKYVPFGPVKDVMPYLIRRAEENTSVAGQTNRELDLIKKERARRKQ
ncbi:MAG: proline dehydrogenase family protein [Flavobacteriaceae bacterium]